MTTITNLKIDPIVDRDSLMLEKIQLAKELGRIDKRLSEIDITLGTIGTLYRDNESRFPDVNAEPPKPPAFTIVGVFSDELLSRFTEDWITDEQHDTHLCVVLENTTVYPARHDMERETMTIEDGQFWRASQLFNCESVTLFNLPSTASDNRMPPPNRIGSKVKLYTSKLKTDIVRRPYAFVEQIRAGYAGFFVAREDIKLVRKP